jgi:hypothetical protein
VLAGSSPERARLAGCTLSGVSRECHPRLSRRTRPPAANRSTLLGYPGVRRRRSGRPGGRWSRIPTPMSSGSARGRTGGHACSEGQRRRGPGGSTAVPRSPFDRTDAPITSTVVLLNVMHGQATPHGRFHDCVTSRLRDIHDRKRTSHGEPHPGDNDPASARCHFGRSAHDTGRTVAVRTAFLPPLLLFEHSADEVFIRRLHSLETRGMSESFFYNRRRRRGRWRGLETPAGSHRDSSRILVA